MQLEYVDIFGFYPGLGIRPPGRHLGRFQPQWVTAAVDGDRIGRGGRAGYPDDRFAIGAAQVLKGTITAAAEPSPMGEASNRLIGSAIIVARW